MHEDASTNPFQGPAAGDGRGDATSPAPDRADHPDPGSPAPGDPDGDGDDGATFPQTGHAALVLVSTPIGNLGDISARAITAPPPSPAS